MKNVAALVFVVSSTGVGCVAEPGDAAEPANELEVLGTSRQALTNDQQSQLDAGKIVSALLAKDLHGIPNTSECTALRNNITALISQGFADTISNGGPTTIRGLPSILYRMNYNSRLIDLRVARKMDMGASLCFPGDTNIGAFTVVDHTNGVLTIDPGPATLTASLGATTGSSAAATMDSLPATAWKWPKTMTYRPAFLGGEPSEYKSQLQNAGFVTSCSIKKSGNYAASLCPLGY